jgi:hypothetical protein
MCFPAIHAGLPAFALPALPPPQFFRNPRGPVAFCDTIISAIAYMLVKNPWDLNFL